MGGDRADGRVRGDVRVEIRNYITLYNSRHSCSIYST